ncbi:unnamed protein product [Closterium sp. NIES-53]
MALRISAEQWDTLEELAKFLMPFNAVTLAAEGSLYPTASRVVPQYNELMDSLEKIRDSTTSPPSVIMRKCIDASLGKLQEYYYSSSDELSVATFLDPAFKLGYFELEDGSSNMGRAVSHVPSEEVLALVRAKWQPYKEKVRREREAATGKGRGELMVVGLGGTSSTAAGGRLVARLAALRAKKAAENKDEIQIYLEEPMQPLSTNPLAYWRRRGDLEGLQAMAKDYLAIPATSAANERLFSQGRNLIIWQRHRLGAERVQACMTLKLWIASYPGTPLGKAAKVAMVDDNVGVDLDEEL